MWGYSLLQSAPAPHATQPTLLPIPSSSSPLLPMPSVPYSCALSPLLTSGANMLCSRPWSLNPSSHYRSPPPLLPMPSECDTSPIHPWRLDLLLLPPPLAMGDEADIAPRPRPPTPLCLVCPPTIPSFPPVCAASISISDLIWSCLLVLVFRDWKVRSHLLSMPPRSPPPACCCSSRCSLQGDKTTVTESREEHHQIQRKPLLGHVGNTLQPLQAPP
jgi:hypothetical protein